MTRRSWAGVMISAAASIAGADTQKRKPTAARKLLDLNAATAAELEQLPGIGPERARLIVKMRERNGLFRCLEELRALPRLTDKQFAKLRERITVAQADGRNPCGASVR